MPDVILYLSDISIPQGIGVIGVFFYIGSFAAVQAEWISGDGIGYSLANVIAASCVIVSLTAEFNLASFIIQVCFISVGLIGIARRLLMNRSAVKSEKTKPAKEDCYAV